MSATNPVGRPRTVQTPEEFDRLVDEFVSLRTKEGKPLTFTGLALHMGFADRRSLYDYCKVERFSLSVKRAQTLIEDEYEQKLTGQNVAGPIFALKNYGWTDKQVQEHTGADGGPMQIAVTHEVIDPRED